MSEILLHPSIQNGLHKGDAQFAGGVSCLRLRRCAGAPVKVKVSASIAYESRAFIEAKRALSS